MKAITLTAPWATLSVAKTETMDHPFKVHETRSWSLPIHVMQRRVAIHQGKGPAGLRSGLVDPVHRVFVEPYNRFLSILGYQCVDPWPSQKERVRRGLYFSAPLPLGAIVGLVTFTECLPAEKQYRHDYPNAKSLAALDDFMLGDYTPGRFAWRMQSAIALPNPIPCRGAQGFWNVPDDVEQAIYAQGVR